MHLCENIIQKTTTKMGTVKKKNIHGKPQDDVDV